MAAPDRLSLDALGLLHGTDKASSRHGYLGIYEEHLAHLRAEPVRVLEIGVLNGASLRMWRDFFHAGTITGVDIRPNMRRLAGERISIEIGDASSEDFLTAVADAHGPFDVILDDGSHRWEDQRIAFTTLWPRLKPRGIFIIEDLHTSYFPNYGAPGQEPMTAWLFRHLHWLVAQGNEPEVPPRDASPHCAIWQRGVRQATFLRKAAIIQAR